MHLIKEQFEEQAKVEEEQVQEEHHYNGHFTKNDGIFQLFLDLVSEATHKSSKLGGCYVKNTNSKFQAYRSKIITPLPSDTIYTEDLPAAYDWRNVNGINYLSWSVNQHIPHYCGSCWAQGALSALADRFIIADPAKYANLALSPQSVINCNEGGSCDGGEPIQVYVAAHKVGVSKSLGKTMEHRFSMRFVFT